MNQDLKDVIKRIYDNDDTELGMYQIGYSALKVLLDIDGVEAVESYVDTFHIDNKNINIRKCLEANGNYASVAGYKRRHHLFDHMTLDDGFISYDRDSYVVDYTRHSSAIKGRFVSLWRSPSKTPRLIITHANCYDGLGVELVARAASFNENTEVLYIGYDYNIKDIMEASKNKLVFAGDISFPLKDLNAIKASAREFYLVDHHKTPFTECDERYTNCYYDMSKSGALLAYEFFFGVDGNIPALIEHISDRDVWNWYHGIDTKAVSLYLDTIMFSHKEKIKLITNHSSLLSGVVLSTSDKLLSDLIAPYLPIVKKEEDEINGVVDSYTPEEVDLAGTKFLVINYPDKGRRSEVLNRISTKYNMPALSFSIKKGNIDMSLRSTSDKDDVDLIARAYNGGGHARASGIGLALTEIDLVSFFTGDRKLISGSTSEVIMPIKQDNTVVGSKEEEHY